MNAPVASWMATLHFAAAVVMLVSLLISLRRVFRGPTPVERILAAQLMGTAGVAVLLLVDAGLSRADVPVAGLIDVALVFAVLAGVAGVAFVYRGWESRAGVGDQEGGDEPGD